MKKDKHTKNIRIAVVVTVLLVAPTALAIGEVLRSNLVRGEKNEKIEVHVTKQYSGCQKQTEF